VTGWSVLSPHQVVPLREHEVVTSVAGGTEPQRLTMALRVVPLVKAGKHWWTHEIVVRNRTGQVLGQDWDLPAISPVHLGILPQMVFAAVADQGKRSALRANNGAPIPETTGDLTIRLLAENPDHAQVPL
jgi:hypothetical protein